MGDRIKLVLDKERSPDNKYHGQKGQIINIQFDDAASVTGESEDNFIYTVRLEDGTVPEIHFRREDIILLEGSADD